MNNIIFFGPPGSGKGTMSVKLAKDLKLRHISTGDIIRSNQERKTKIGQLADKIVDSGGLLPDEIINEMMKQEIIDDKTSLGFIFDGFPRTPGQAKMIDEFMHRRKTPITHIIFLDVPKNIVLNRIVERGKTSGRKDDTEEAFPIRWDAYTKETIPSLNYFESRGKVFKIDGTKEIDVVYEEILKLFI